MKVLKKTCALKYTHYKASPFIRLLRFTFAVSHFKGYTVRLGDLVINDD